MLRVSDDECAALLQLFWNESITGLALVNEDGSFRRANPSFCRIVEYSEAELKRLKFQDITDPADTAADVEMAALVAAGEYECYELTKSYITKTKRTQPVLLRVTGLKINGRFTYFVGEVAPLDSPPAERRRDEAIHRAARRRQWLHGLRDNWAVIAALSAGAAMFVAQVIQHLKPHTGG